MDDFPDLRFGERVGYLEATLADLAITNLEARRALDAYRITYGIREVRCVNCAHSLYAIPSKYGEWCSVCRDFTRHRVVASKMAP